MRSFCTAAWVVVLSGSVGARVVQAPASIVTSAPSIASMEVVKRDGPDAVSLAQVLLTAIPLSLREIAATNVPAVSSILWKEFLDDKRPQWFQDLPWDIQSYLIEQFGPPTAVPTAPPTWTPSASIPSETWPSQSVETSQWWNPSSSETWGSGQPQSTNAPGASQSQPPSSGTITFVTSVVTVSVGSTNIPTTKVTASSSSSADISSSSTLSLASKPASTPASASITTSTSTADPAPDSSNHSTLTKSKKIGLGVGIPFGIIGTAALFLGVCLLLRRRQRKKVDGSIPPSSPGFIPRFAFQEKPAEDIEHQPLNRESLNSSFQDLHNVNWNGDEIVESSSSGETIPTLSQVHSQQPVMAPALFHTHSSNRARGKRTSYTSLRSVPEVSESEEAGIESPVLPHHGITARSSPLRHSPTRQNPKRNSPPRVLIPAPPIPAASQINRKPVANIDSISSPAAADLASQSLLRQTMPDHYTLPSQSPPPPAGFGVAARVSANNTSNSHSPYVSPIEEPLSSSQNPFGDSNTNLYSYEEDYGPEYQHTYYPVSSSNLPPSSSFTTLPQHISQDSHHNSQDDNFDDTLSILYGGNTDLTRYPSPSSNSSKHSKSKTEWPLRNFSNHSNGHRRKSSPLWDRVYESP